MGTLASGSIDLKSLSVAGAPNKYITKITGDGIKIHDSQNQNLNYIQLTSNGMDIYQEVNSAPTKVAEFGADGIDFYGFYYPGSGGVSIQQFGQIAHLGTTCQLGNDVDNHIVINDTGLLLYSKAISSPHAVLGTSNNLSTYNNYKKYFKTTWEYGTPFSFNCSVEKGLGTYTFYVEENGEFVNTGIVIIIDDMTYFISSSASSMGSYLDYTFSSEDNNNVRTVNIMIEFTGNAIFPGPRFQFGKNNNPIGTNSCTIGEGLTALANSQIALGRYNELDFESMLVVGNGTDNINRSNLMTISNNEVKIGNSNGGHTIINEDGMRIYGGDGTVELANIGYGYTEDDLTKTPYYSIGQRKSPDNIPWAPNTNYSRGETCIYNNKYYVCSDSHTSSNSFQPIYWYPLYGYCSFAEGLNTIAGQGVTHAEGINTIAVSVGNSTAHAEGRRTYASLDSHAEGSSTIAISDSHAEGESTYAYNTSHAEGCYTYAHGLYSHAQNNHTAATEANQTVIGKYNIATRSGGSGTRTDPYTYVDAGNYAFIVGNGKNENNRSNALTVDWNGNIMSQGMAGQVIMYAGSTAPTGWLLCDGASYLREDYPQLFAALGGTNSPWGLPDSTHFNVPDFRDRFAVGAGTTYSNNSQGGFKDAAVITHTHSISSSGGHTHTITAKYDQDIKVESGSGTRYKATGNSTSTSMATIASDTGKHTHSVPAPTGAVAGTNRNLPPYIGINFIIATGKTY